MKTTIGGLLLVSTILSVGCANAFARHDLFQRSDTRIGRVIETTRKACRAQQPKNTLPSGTEYERCVIDGLRQADLAAAR
jgi:hypothetical protein